MGKELRARYNDFLGDMWTQDILFAQSTDVMRTKMSLDLVLAGLFPPTRPKWLAEMKWQPIPYINLPIHNDPVIIINFLINYKNNFSNTFSGAFRCCLSKLPKNSKRILSIAGVYIATRQISRICRVSFETCRRKLHKCRRCFEFTSFISATSKKTL